MSAQVPPARRERVRARDGLRSAAAQGQRYLERPFASLQLIILAGGGLLAFGIMMAASTTISAGSEINSGIWSQLVKEVLFVAIGLPIFYVAARMPPRSYRMIVYPALLIAFLALTAVLIPGVGVLNYNARRWIDLGPLPFQPSEFAKLAILLWGADLLVRKQQRGTLTRARHVFVPLVPVFVLVCGLVMLEPDLGTTLCLLMILIGLLWTLGLPLRYFAGLLLLVAGAVSLLAVSASYRLQRLLTFTDPFKDKQGSGYHTVQGLYALASGGFYGVGLGNGTSKYTWVPNANTDYVFSVIGEELGLIGTVVVLLLFGLFAYTGMRISRRSADPFARLVAGAATIWICGQALINIGYVTGLLPVTGIPLPFISAGGTSLLATFVVFGMLVSFARHEPEAVAAAQARTASGQRSRIERWLRITAAKPYLAPARGRRPATSPAEAQRPPKPAARPAAKPPVKPAAKSTARPAARPPRTPNLAATGTDGRPRRSASDPNRRSDSRRT
ncbi:cell division-specific peptidoglycan biosynthesis regulator FtsW [Jatrophihabitans sp. GAS493]|uniref:putative lipid II flippase FtsW n=1 Tax=Jatrophihabitans sp. GAS493 TaxID=1907575 RepID=UPI000BB87910|nr:putative lipid II flippase FtsW [Jatrophihabitans sp. GAS493]SOD74327.1 cell division-specific peptidoglycan biosynthesis regulator FtsW [Jatrophihabitans sp. GAS493]